MKSNSIFSTAFCVLASMVAVPFAGAQHSLQAPQDPGEPAVIATCKVPPPARQGGGAPPAGAAAAPVLTERDYTVAAIPGIMAAGTKWTQIWKTEGNNTDGIIATSDGNLLVAQNDNSKIVKIDVKTGKTTDLFTDTHTSGAVSRNSKGELFVVERGLHERIEQLEPKRKVVADSYNGGDPLDCIGLLNDVTAASNGGLYISAGGVIYMNPAGVITKQGENIRANGIILSPDEKHLYVTNGPTLAAFDVQPDGTLTNQRSDFGKLEAGGAGDGSAVDAEGRIYVTSGPGLQVFSPEGKYLGLIATPRPLISVAFSGPGKKNLYVVSFQRAAPGAKDAAGKDIPSTGEIYMIPTLTKGYEKRAK